MDVKYRKQKKSQDTSAIRKASSSKGIGEMVIRTKKRQKQRRN